MPVSRGRFFEPPKNATGREETKRIEERASRGGPLLEVEAAGRSVGSRNVSYTGERGVSYIGERGVSYIGERRGKGGGGGVNVG